MSTEDLDTSGASDRFSPPHIPPTSPGSSVSSRLQEEYTELLKHVVISSIADQTEGVTLSFPSPRGSQHSMGGSRGASGAHTPAQQTEDDLQLGSSQSTPTPRNQRDMNANHSSIVEAWQVDNDNAAGDHFQTSLSTISDPAVGQMSLKMDGWLGRLKTDILAEFGGSSLQMLETQRLQQERELKELLSEKQRLEREVNRLTELVATCEQSMGRKDGLIENLTTGLAQQKDKTKAAGVFYRWKLECMDKEREKFCEQIASLHHERQLRQRVLKAWFGQVQTRWRVRVEKQCQEQAQAVCRTLSQDYEAKIASLNSTVDHLEHQVGCLQHEREAYAESVKKAFMRGVCALNMEAMSAFSPDGPDGAATAGADESMTFDPSLFSTLPLDPTGPAYRHDSLNTVHMTKNTSQTLRPVIPDHNASHSLPELSVSHGLPSHVSTSQPKKSALRKDRPKMKTSASHPLQGQTLVPPMASVVVERHQPVTKQTMGKATASKFIKGSDAKAAASGPSGHPKGSRPGVSISLTTNQTFKPLAGQARGPNSIKVVD